MKSCTVTMVNDDSVEVVLEGSDAISFQSLGIGNSKFETFDFALWAVLPIAMRLGLNVKFREPISKRAYESAINVARVWCRWLPDHFSMPALDATIVEIEPEENLDSVAFFSGGIDSTYSAIKLSSDGHRNIDSLTVHGMDYKAHDDVRFNSLVKQTKLFRERYFRQSLFVKTNIYDVYNSVSCNPSDGHITHVFALFASGSLFPSYGRYFIAADYRLDQQYIVHPYGSNSATNRLMTNSTGALITRDDEVSRAQKAAFLVSDDFNLSSLSICVDYKVRPKNCGVCSKCMRTKAMFFASQRRIPEVFIDCSFDEHWHQSISLNRKIDRVFFGDILDAFESGLGVDVPGLDAARERWRKVSISARNNPFFGIGVKDFVRQLLPIPLLEKVKKIRSNLKRLLSKN